VNSPSEYGDAEYSQKKAQKGISPKSRKGGKEFSDKLRSVLSAFFCAFYAFLWLLLAAHDV
jgi:hypothetical protein